MKKRRGHQPLSQQRSKASWQGITAKNGSIIHDVTQIYTDVLNISPDASNDLTIQIRSVEFKALIEERTRVFVGRDFIFSAIERLLSEMPSGYILIRGEPGIGKTSLLAQLVKMKGCVHHFNIALQNLRSTRAFLANICAQLILRYKLGYAVLPPEATRDSAFLTQLLGEAAASTDNWPVVLLVDALDEAEDVEIGAFVNRLYLPPALPKGVFVVLTSREQADFRLSVDRREDIYLSDDDPQNLDDVKHFIQTHLKTYEQEMTVQISAWKVTNAEFVDLITEKSQGNFMYLVHVLQDIKVGALSQQTIDSIRDLPRGLRAYYERHWRTMHALDPERFEKFYEPVLRILATVREPVSAEAIEEWTKLEPARIRQVVREWRPFLNESQSKDGDTLYRVYHASFQDFLAEEGVGLKPFHNLIAETALRKIESVFGNKTQ
jgi:hypothetical protein